MIEKPVAGTLILEISLSDLALRKVTAYEKAGIVALSKCNLCPLGTFSHKYASAPDVLRRPSRATTQTKPLLPIPQPCHGLQ